MHITTRLLSPPRGYQTPSRSYDNFAGENNHVVIFLINTCCDHFKIEHIFIGFSFSFFEDNYIFKGK